MRFTSLFTTAVAAFAAIVSAQSNAITSPTAGTVVTAGSSTTIQWTPSDQGTITLVLRSGSSTALNAGTTIASGIPNSGSYTWAPDSTLPTASDYTIEIISTASGSQPNYSPRFSVTGGSASSSASGSSTTSGSSSTITGTSTTSGNSTMTTTTSSSSSTSSSNSTTTSSSSTKSSSSSKSTSASATSSGSSAPSSGAVVMHGRDTGLVAAVIGLAGLAAMI